MPVTKKNLRHSRTAGPMPRLSVTGVLGESVDTHNLIRSIDAEVTPPCELRAASTPDLTVSVGPVYVTNPLNNRRHTISQLTDGIPDWVSGTVTFPAAPGGSITTGGGPTLVLTMGASSFVKVGINLRSDNLLELTLGTSAATEALATEPTVVDGAFAIGYIVIQAISGVIQPITNSNIVQYSVGGAGSGGSGSGKNYLAKYFDASAGVGTVLTLASPTSDIADAKAFYADAVSGTSAIALNTSSPLRGKSNYLISLAAGGIASNSFLQFPTFALDRTDYQSFEDLIVQFDALPVFSGAFGVYIVRYDAAGVYQNVQTVISEYGNTTPTVGGTEFPFASTGLITSTNGSNNQLTRNLFKWRASVGASGDLFALRIVNYSGSATTISLDAISVGPSATRAAIDTNPSDYYADVSRTQVKGINIGLSGLSTTGNLVTTFANYTMRELCRVGTGVLNFGWIGVTAANRGEYYYDIAGGASLAGDKFIQFPVRSFIDQDLGKPISITLDVFSGGVGQFDIVALRYNSVGAYQETLQVFGNPLSDATVVPSATLITPPSTGVARNNLYFLQSSSASPSDVYALRIRRLSGAVAFRCSGPSMGTKSLNRTAADTDWQTFTPVFTGFGTTTITSAMYRRVGSDMEIEIRLFAGTPTAVLGSLQVPFGLTIGSPKSVGMNSGIWERNSVTINNQKGGVLISASGGTEIFFGVKENPFAISPFAPQNGNTLVATNEIFSVHAKIPITQWSSNTFSANNALTQYASNTDVTNVDTVANGFYNGADGALFGNYSGTTRTKRVRFATPYNVTDRLILIATNNGNKFAEISVTPFQSTSPTTGIAWSRVAGSDTDFDVLFGSAGIAANLLSGGAGAWSLVSNNTNFRWNLVKVSAGGDALLPLSAANITGQTTAPAAGFVGEVIRATGGGIPTGSITGSAQNAMSLTLPPGTWRIEGQVGWINGPTSTYSVPFILASISTVSATENVGSQAVTQIITSPSINTTVAAPPILTSNATEVTYFLVVRTGISTVGGAAVLAAGVNYGSILMATRIA